MNTEANTLPALLLDDGPEGAWALENPKGVAARVTQAREEGYVCLSPFQRQFAMEFVLTGTSLRKIARKLDLPQPFIQRMYNDPIVRAYISDLQKEVAAHRLINDQWIENQIMQNLPKLLGEEPVDIVTSKGSHVKHKKYHGAELVSLFKHFSSQGQEKAGQGKGGVNVQINFGDLGIAPAPGVTFNLGQDGEDNVYSDGSKTREA